MRPTAIHPTASVPAGALGMPKVEEDAIPRRHSDAEVLPGMENLACASPTAPFVRRKTSGTEKIVHQLRQQAREKISVQPTDLAELYKLHAEMRHPDKQGLSDAELLAIWDAPGTGWHAFGELPRNAFGCPAGSEEAFNRRGVRLRPTTSTRPEDLLEQCGVWVHNSKGRKNESDTTIGQDNYCIALLEGGWELYGVFDGHGPDGHWPSQRAAQTLPSFLQTGDCAAMMRQGRIDAALIRAFDQVQQDLVHASWPPSRRSPYCRLPFCGCTAVCMLRHPSKSSVWVAHVGDSRAVLMAPGRGAARETEDHKPTVEAERKRIEEAGCEVRMQEFADGLTEARIYIQGKSYPGIMMTRSLGDLLVNDKGVIATPEVAEWDLDSREGAVMLIASDGIWEFIESREASETVLQGREGGQSLRQIAARLVRDAEDLWETKEPGYCDDITALLVALDGPGLRQVCRTGPSKSETCCASGCALQ